MKFQYILLTFFGVMAVVGAIMFSVGPSDKTNSTASGGDVHIWGTFSSADQSFREFIARFNSQYKDQFSIVYQYHDPKNFDHDIVEALASGKGPDILLLPDDLVVRHSDKIQLIPYQSFPPEVFRSSYVQAAEIYMRPEGLLALPFVIDPMVMYWNRDLFNNASVPLPPRYWDEFLSITPKLTVRDPKSFLITQSAIAFGEYGNVLHAKDVLTMLFLQIGNSLTGFNNGQLSSTIVTSTGSNRDTVAPAEDLISAFRFFMDFSNPQKPNYTWGRARENSTNEFVSGNLAVHFDYASAYKGMSAKNPHLNFAVASVPNPRGTKTEITFAKVYGLGILKSSKNKATAFLAAQHLLTDLTPARDFAAIFGLPPVIRSLLAQPPPDAALSVFYAAAIRGRTWLDPNPDLSDKAFQNMVESVSSGRSSIADAVTELDTALDAIITARK